LSTETSALIQNRKPLGIVPRLVYIALVLAVELLLIPALAGPEGLAQKWIGWGSVVARGVLGFGALFATFAWLKYRTALGIISTGISSSRISLTFLMAHFASMILFGLLYSSAAALSRSPFSNLFAGAWLATGLATVFLIGFAFIPLICWQRIVRDTKFLWIGATAAALVASLGGKAIQSLWPLATEITFLLSQLFLSQLVSGLVVDPGNFVIGTERFRVQIDPPCSGLEGVVLIVVFGVVWLTIFRDQCRFPRALILLPAGVILIFILNAVRIAALVLIGNAGAEQIATRGFHSQAGWMMFSLVAMSFSVAARNVHWLTIPDADRFEVRSFQNPSARWLLPFLMILAAGMISTAMTGDFEWFYPLRVLAGGLALAFLWRRYKDLNWRVGWLAPAFGIGVFLIWIGLDHFAVAPETMPASLAVTSPLVRILWLTSRVLGAIVIVPLAEELAFRGFLYRRLLSPDFDSVSFRRFSVLALVASSLIFGLLHGNRWFVGTVAGVFYGIALIRRGSIGDAVVAHATTNALLAIDVLAFHQWHLW
jgi:exosortase E/protease (VPEID-CTERM system)